MKVPTKQIREDYKNIINMLRFFVEIGNFGTVDRVAGALSFDVVKSSLYDALRIIRSEAVRSPTLKIGERSLTCYYEDVTPEKERDPRYKFMFKGKVQEVIKGPTSLFGKEIFYVPMPYIPDEHEVATFLDDVQQKGLDIAHIVAGLAMTFRPGGG